ncbi:MAG TPA: hypothetical protein VGU46_11210 [Acidobacteriaceae bacterium]|nr:hypothetical protein [Acidobacteriaceae bacterium]
MPRLSRLSLLFAAVLCTQAPAQPQPSTQAETTQTKSETDKLVDQLIELAAHNRTALPSLTAHETIVVTQDEFVFLGKKSTHAEATVRLVRNSPR